MVMFTDNAATTTGRVAVVGGGAAGALVALQLLETGVEVVIVEPSRELGFGLPYRTRHPLHLLNVPAGRMSAFPDRPDDFVSWLDGRGPEAAGAYVPRRLFGEYLRATLTEAGRRSSRLTHLRARATAIELGPEGVAISLADGSTVAAGYAVLAIGQPQEQAPLEHAWVADQRRVVLDPWKPGALDQIRRGDAVLLVGTGLSMVDIALELSERAVASTAVSRHGLLPHAHAAIPLEPQPIDVPDDARLGELVALVRAASRSHEHWRPVLDGLRSLTQERWARLTVAEQSRFLRHLAPYWNVHRHRMPPPTAAALARLQRDGQLQIRAGAVRRITSDGPRVAVDLQSRGQVDQRLVVDHVVNCTGPRSQLRVGTPPLVRALLDAGLARLDVHGIGLDTDADGALVGSDGTSSGRLHAVGALRRGTLLESTAIPDLRHQAAGLAAVIATRAMLGAAR
jgi:uncharacterized NAD(P)/FAD-binding protein YdhS